MRNWSVWGSTSCIQRTRTCNFVSDNVEEEEKVVHNNCVKSEAVERVASRSHPQALPSLLRPREKKSAGKRESGKTRKGNRWLRSLLVECAWAAGCTKASYFHAQFRQLARRRGAKRAAVAVGHSLLIAAYHIIRDGVPHRDLGPTHFDSLHHHRLTSYHTRRLEALGYRVNLEAQEAA